MDGLVHVSELSWKHVDHPSSVVAVGDEIEVQVLEVDLDRERISLSLKATQQDPWEEFASGHRVGELVYGRVTKLVPFGAFVQVGDGIEGLVHISEMSAHHVELPEQVVTPGEELWVKVIDLDLQRRRISLSIKQAAEGGVVAAEYQEHFGEHAYDESGNYVGPSGEIDEAWAEYYEEHGLDPATGQPKVTEPASEPAAEEGSGNGAMAAALADAGVGAPAPEAEPDAAAAPEAEAAAEPEAEAAAEPEAAAAPEAEPEAAPEPEAEAAPEVEAAPEPEAVSTEQAVAEDEPVAEAEADPEA
jgi:small subunit ribosomal protein S1